MIQFGTDIQILAESAVRSVYFSYLYDALTNKVYLEGSGVPS
jgi:hypothetical protein